MRFLVQPIKTKMSKEIFTGLFYITFIFFDISYEYKRKLVLSKMIYEFSIILLLFKNAFIGNLHKMRLRGAL